MRHTTSGSMKQQFILNERLCGTETPAYITAEIGLNHNGSIETALDMVDRAAESGVDAVKFQVFRAESFVSGNIAKAAHQKTALKDEETVWQMWKRLEFSFDDLKSVADRARQRGVGFYASPFDEQSVDLLVSLGASAMKVASGEVTNLPLISAMAAAKLPVIMSVAMASLGEIEAAVETVARNGSGELALLHCVASYPTSVGHVNLARMARLHEIFGVPVGYSDHTVGHYVCVASAALGATFIEKHFTLDRNLPGTDHIISADPAMMTEMIKGIRAVEAAVGDSSLVLLDCESEGRTLFRRSLVATADIAAGTQITAEMLGAKRPATGITPGHRDIVISRTARQDIKSGDPIMWEAV